MGFIEIFLIAISLSLDAFAVSIGKGIALKNVNNKNCIFLALNFGLFQAIMPFLGFFFGSYFSRIFNQIDHFIVFFLLGFIGFSMIKDSLKGEHKINSFITVKEMFMLGIATSIDAFAVGVSFAFLKVNIIASILTIGTVCFLLSFIGVKLGNKLGNKFSKKSSLIGGIILFLLGFKILLEHLGIL